MDKPEKSQSARQIAVLLGRNVPRPFDYLAPPEMALEEGSYVSVPFGRGNETGVVWALQASAVPREKCKEIATHHAYLPPMPQTMRRFLTWVSEYSCASLGNVLKLALADPEGMMRKREETFYALTAGATARTETQRHILALLRQEGALRAEDIIRQTGVDQAAITRLLKRGALESQTRVLTAPPPVLSARSVTLSAAQAHVVSALRPALGQGFSAHLLDGVTGSGKTEIYFETIEETLRQGKQALVLLPEIALSVQWLSRFEERFGFAASLWHSAVSKSQRTATWQGVAKGELPLVVGARSALFLPFPQLGLIVLDEEHDGSYKQEDGVIYHGRDMAVVRAHLEKIPVILASATPSLETVVNCEQGKYICHRLESRYGDMALPEVRLIDLRAEKMPASQWISPPLAEAVRMNLEAGRQSLLFLNRRGYAPLLLCRTCGHRFECADCSAWLVLHKTHQRLECHHCGFKEPAPSECPRCGSPEERLAPCGPGIERLAEETLHTFAGARLLVLSSETLEKSGEMERAIHSILSGEAQIIIGTQLLAKGHHFPALGLVGVIDADLGLTGGDPRAAERTYQLLHQLAGRAGREQSRGQVMLQTASPEHPVMRALQAGDRDGLYAIEKRIRREAGLPPYGRLAALILEGTSEEAVERAAHQLARAIPPHPEIRVLGPAKAPMYKLRGRYRMRFLLKAPKSALVQDYLHLWLARCPTPSTVRMKVDIDPISFL